MKRSRDPGALTTLTTSRFASRARARTSRQPNTGSSSAAPSRMMSPEYGVRHFLCRMRAAAQEVPHSKFLAAILLLIAVPAFAKPALHPAPDYPIPAQLEAGQQYHFRVIYQDDANDRPTSAALVPDGP